MYTFPLAWIGSFGLGTTFLVSPLSHLIYNRFGFNRLIGLSMTLCVMSWISSSFVQRIQLLSLTYSLLWGVGAGFANYASTVIIQKSFHKHLSLANGIASSGTGFGTLVLGQLLTWLLERFGHKWTFRACALVPMLFLFLLYSQYVSKRQNSPKEKALTKHVSTSDPEHTSGLTNHQDTPNTYSVDNITNKTNHGSSAKNENIKKKTKLKEANANKSFKLKELFHKDLWHNMKFTIFVAGVSVFLFGAFIPFIFLVSRILILLKRVLLFTSTNFLQTKVSSKGKT